MKVSAEIISMLNKLLSAEHAAYVQYETHARMCENWGYKKLVEYLTERANQEREHTQELIDRIIFLEGIPIFYEIGEVLIGKEVFAMFEFDKKSELQAIVDYTEAIVLCEKEKDFGSRKILEHILEEEEKHLNDIEANFAQIEQAGYENYLSVQIGG